jgi:hypothetical protein
MTRRSQKATLAKKNQVRENQATGGNKDKQIRELTLKLKTVSKELEDLKTSLRAKKAALLLVQLLQVYKKRRNIKHWGQLKKRFPSDLRDSLSVTLDSVLQERNSFAHPHGHGLSWAELKNRISLDHQDDEAIDLVNFVRNDSLEHRRPFI